MKALCKRKDLLAAFGMVSGVVPARSPKPILQNVKLVSDPELGTILMATDLEVGIRHKVLGVRAYEPGSVILPTGKMQQILATSGDEELDVETNGDRLIVRTRSAQFDLPTEDPSLYPEVPDFGATSYHVVSASDLRKLIRRTMFATDVESTRYALGGVLIELDAESITMVGTDGRRLAKMSAAAEAENGVAAPTGSPVIPVKALKLIDRNLDDPDLAVHIAIQAGSAALIRTADQGAIIYTRLVEGPLPPLPGRLPGRRRGQDPPGRHPAPPGRRAGLDRHQRREPGRRLQVRRRHAHPVEPGRRRRQLAGHHADPLRGQGRRHHLRPPLPHRRPQDDRRRHDDHRRADRPQERRRLQDRGRLYLRRHAADEGP